MFLKKTIEDILANIEGDTEIIAVCDGYWPDPPIEDNPRVILIHHTVPIGQRSACNEAVRVSKAKYIMKADAHCAFDKGFDVKMMVLMQDDYTMIPVMRNLHAFDWVCENGHRRYQGPSGVCKECGKETKMDIVWIAKTNPQSTSYCFDSEPHFQYFQDFKKRPEYREGLKIGLTETMSIQGSCFMVTREKYFELDLCNEDFGSWGSQGLEISMRTWLSGGRVVVNHTTYYAHLFRTSGGDFGFPYPISGKQVEHAKKSARDLFFENKWEKQVRSLSWLIERFNPVPGWSKEELARIKRFDLSSNLSTLVTSSTSSNGMPGTKVMPSSAESFSEVERRGSIASHDISSGKSQDKMSGITTIASIAKVVEDRDMSSSSTGDRINKPSIDKPVDINSFMVERSISIPIPISSTSPQPTTSNIVESNMREDLSGLIGTDISNSKEFHDISIPRPNEKVKGIIYYSDNRHDELIVSACQKQIKKGCNGNEIISVSLKPIDFGKNIVLNAERSKLTQAKQILLALENSTSDIIFFCETDVLYHPSHFKFTPPSKDVFYYNDNKWRVDFETGQALFYHCAQVSGLCCYRELALEHYRTRVARIEKEGKYDNKIGYEPGLHKFPRGIDNVGYEMWFSEFPNIDIRHKNCYTSNRWTQAEFRDKNTCLGWTMADEVPFWGVTKGRFKEILRGI